MNWGTLKLPILATFVAILLTNCGGGGTASSSSSINPAVPPGVSILGTSGGNINDFSSKYCCSGTLGALVENIGGDKYILSNNHVLARTNSAKIGEGVNHPGLIDQNCGRKGIVATLSMFEPLMLGTKNSPGGPNLIDAALAYVVDSEVANEPAIENIGMLSTDTVAAFASQPVQKSGRTTGYTVGTVAATGVTILVGYPADCGEKASLYGLFTNQILITPGSFSGGGDSGSLIVERVSNGDPPRAVGLLFARTSSSTLASPIDTILSSFNVSMVGQASSSSAPEFIGPTQGEDAALSALSATETTSPATVVSITYESTGGADGKRDLLMTLRVVDDFGRPVLNAHPGIIIDRDGALYGTGTGAVTDADGVATYTLDSAPDGIYAVTVSYLDADGLSFSGADSAPSNAFAKGIDVSPREFHILDDSAQPSAAAPSMPATIQQATDVKRRNRGALLSVSGVVGHGIGTSEAGFPQIEVYLEVENAEAQSRIPASIDGIPCHTVITGSFVAE